MPTSECLAAILPFYHSFGISGVLDNLMGGLRFVLIPNFTLQRFLQAVQDYKVGYNFVIRIYFLCWILTIPCSDTYFNFTCQITIVSLVPAIAIQLAKQPVEKRYDLSSLRVIRCGASALSAETIRILKQKLNCTVYQGYGMTEATVRSHANYKGVNREGSIGIVMPFCQSKLSLKFNLFWWLKQLVFFFGWP